MADLNVQLILRLVDRATAPARAAVQQLESGGGRLRRLGAEQLDLSRQQIVATAQQTRGLYMQAAAVAAQGWAYTKLLGPAIAFESKMAEVGKVVDFDGATGLSELGDDIQALVTSGALPMAADGIADIVAAAAQANLIDAALPDADKRRQLVEFAEAAGKMGIAFDISADLAGQAMAVWRSQMGLSQAEAIKLGDAVNHLSNNMNASAADVTNIIGRQGGFAKVAGLTTAEIAALATAFRTAAPSSEVAATAMKNFTATLVAGEAITKRQAAVMQRLGFDATELAQRMRVDARGAIIDVMEALKALPEHEQAASLRQLFGDEAVGAVAPLLENLENLRRAFELVGDETSYAGAMQAEYEGIADTTASKLVVFGNHLNRIAIQLTPLLSVLTDILAAVEPVLAAVTDWMKAHPEAIKIIGGLLAALFVLKVAFIGLLLVKQQLIMGFWVFNALLGAGTWAVGAAMTAFAKFGRVMLAFGHVVRALFPWLLRGFAALRVAIMAVARATLLNPLALALAAIAALVYVIYDNWAGIVEWFRAKVARVAEAFDEGLLNGVLKLLAEFNPFTLIYEAAEGLFTYLTGWDFADVRRALADAFDIDLFQAGVDLIKSLWAGITGKMDELVDWIRRKLSGAFVLGDDAAASVMDTPQVQAAIERGELAGRPSRVMPASATGVYDRLGGPSIMDMVAGQRALGGPVRAGQIYRWLEEGQEMFVPRTDGMVVSNRELQAMRAGRGMGRAGGISIGGITINAAPGQSPSDIARAVRRELERLARRGQAVLHDGGSYAG